MSTLNEFGISINNALDIFYTFTSFSFGDISYNTYDDADEYDDENEDNINDDIKKLGLDKSGKNRSEKYDNLVNIILPYSCININAKISKQTYTNSLYSTTCECGIIKYPNIKDVLLSTASYCRLYNMLVNYKKSNIINDILNIEIEVIDYWNH